MIPIFNENLHSSVKQSMRDLKQCFAQILNPFT